MGKTPGKWIKTLLLGKKSPKSNSASRSEKLRNAKKDDLVVSAQNLSVDPPVVPPQPVSVTAAPRSGDDSKANLESSKELELEQAVIKVQAAFRAHQARRASRTLKGIIRLQAVIRGHLVRRQAVATFSCIWGIVKFQALVRGQKARSSDNGIRFRKTHMEADHSEALQLSTCSWMDNPTKLVIVDKLLVSSPTALPLKIQYGPEEPNSAKVWLERWSHLRVWSPTSRATASIPVPKPKSKKRSYQAAVETEKARPRRGVVKKPYGPNSGNGSNRFSAGSEKPKRNVRKSSLSKDLPRTESVKAKDRSRKIRSEGSPRDVKGEEKPRLSLKRSSLSNGKEKANRRSAEKKKDTKDAVQTKPKVEVSDVLEGADTVESAEKERNTADSVQIDPDVSDVLEVVGEAVEPAEKEKDSVQIEPEVSSDILEVGEDAVKSAEKEKDPEVKVSDVLEGGEATVESAEKERDTTDEVATKNFDVEKEEKLQEEDEQRTAETSEDPKCSEEANIVVADKTKSSERRVSLSEHIESQNDGHTHSGRKIPSYMAPTASAKARVKGGEVSPRLSQEKTEKNGTLRRHSLPSPANGKVNSTTISPKAHKLLLASGKGSINGDKSFSSSSKNISDKSNRTEWKR